MIELHGNINNFTAQTVKRNLIVNIIKSHINVIMGMIILKKSIQSAMEH